MNKRRDYYGKPKGGGRDIVRRKEKKGWFRQSKREEKREEKISISSHLTKRKGGKDPAPRLDLEGGVEVTESSGWSEIG